MSEKIYFINEEIPFFKVKDDVKRKVIAYGGGLMTVEVHFQKGAIGDLHQHIHEQVAYCVKGSFEFDVSGEKHMIKAGDSVWMPSDSLHGAVALEDSILLDIFTPQREDFK